VRPGANTSTYLEKKMKIDVYAGGGGYNWPSLSWGIQIRGPGSSDWGVPFEKINYDHEFCRTLARG
jgi:hypothetical protein